MCFVLYAGTAKPLTRQPWNKEAPDLSIASLTERDVAMKAHFSKPEVQYIGSTSGCSCDFPFVILQKGEWPFFAELENKDPKQAATSTIGSLWSASYDLAAKKQSSFTAFGMGILRRDLASRKRCPWSDFSNRISVSKNRVFIESGFEADC